MTVMIKQSKGAADQVGSRHQQLAALQLPWRTLTLPSCKEDGDTEAVLLTGDGLLEFVATVDG